MTQTYRRAAALLTVLVLAACGSTVQVESGRVEEFLAGPGADGAQTPSGEASAAEDAGDLASPGGTASADATGQAGARAAKQDATRAGAKADTGGPRAAGGTIPGRHPGVTGDRITFGFIYTEGVEDFGKGIGAEASGGNPKRQIEAVVKAVNDAGGVAGRKVRLLTYPFKAGQPINSQLQAACAHFTQDNKTFAVSGNPSVGTNGVGEVLYQCLAGKDVAYIENANVGDREAYARHPNIAYAPATLNADRALAVKIDALAADGWFGSKPVIGVHAIEAPMWRRVVDRVVKPRLAAHGYAVKEEFFARVGATGPEGVGDYPSATVRFKNSGVTHVLNVGAPPSFFAQAADSQGWRPKWSVYSELAPSFWVQNVPPRQLVGSRGIGWAPSRDLQPADRGKPVNAAAKRCAGIMRAAGENTASVVAWEYQLAACNSVFFLEAALGKAAEVSTAGLAAGMVALGKGYQAPPTWQTRFASDRRDGAGAYRMLAFVEACRCYRYASKLRPVR